MHDGAMSIRTESESLLKVSSCSSMSRHEDSVETSSALLKSLRNAEATFEIHSVTYEKPCHGNGIPITVSTHEVNVNTDYIGRQVDPVQNACLFSLLSVYCT